MSFSLFNRGAFRFAQDGAPMLVLDDVTIELPGGSPFAVASLPPPEVAASGLRPATPPPAADAEPAPAAASPVVTEPAPAAEASLPTTPAQDAPAALEPPPPQSQAELDLYAQVVHLADGFNGDQALAELLASGWAAQNGWQGAGGAPIG